MKTKRIFLMCLVTAFTMAMTSCKKKEQEPEPEPTPTEDTDQSSAADNNVSENTANDIEAMGSQASENSALTTFRGSGMLQESTIAMAPCATVTSVLGSKIFTVDFGASCTGADGRVRSGKLIYDFSGSTSGAQYYRNPGFKLSVTSQNYVVDGYSVTITSKTIENTTPNLTPGTNLKWAVNANLTISKPGGGVINWTCSRTKELLNTNDTNCYRGQSKSIVWTKAKVKLNGSASGTNASNETYTAVAVDLVRDFNCSPSLTHPHRHPFISGTIDYTPANRPLRHIDYGNGACDFLATVTINSKAFTMNLP
jgi:hypothetical protein